MKHRQARPIASGVLIVLCAAAAGLVAACADSSLRPDDAHRAAPRDMVSPVLFTPPITPVITDEWCVILEDGVDPYDVANQVGLTVLRYSPGSNLVLYGGPLDGNVFPSTDGVTQAQENDVVIWSAPLDLTMGFSQGEWDFDEVEDQTALLPLKLPEVHKVRTGAGVRVAVLDTGVDPAHPHLRGRVDLLPPSYVLGSLETPNGIDDDGNGTVDDAYGHGTHVAGTILYMAPQARVLSVRVLNEEGWGTVFDLALGLEVARRRHVDIVNLSLSLTGEVPVISRLIGDLQQAGIAVLAASGNGGGTVQYPASDDGTISVAATDSTGMVAGFSGAYVADVAAPGVRVASSFPPDRLAYATGTSTACAVASGSLALASQGFGGLNAVGWGVDALLQTAHAIPPSGAVAAGDVRPLNAVRALPVPALLSAGP